MFWKHDPGFLPKSALIIPNAAAKRKWSHAHAAASCASPSWPVVASAAGGITGGRRPAAFAFMYRHFAFLSLDSPNRVGARPPVLC